MTKPLRYSSFVLLIALAGVVIPGCLGSPAPAPSGDAESAEGSDAAQLPADLASEAERAADKTPPDSVPNAAPATPAGAAKPEASPPAAENAATDDTPATATASAPTNDSASGEAATTDVTPNASVPGGEAEPKSPADNEPVERIVLLAPAGPLVLDVHLRVGTQSFTGALERLVDETMAATDVDGDGKSTWREVADSPRFQSGQYGNLAADTEEERSQLIRIYDTDKDGQVDRDELPRFITRNAGGGRSFSLRSSNEFRSSNRRASPARLLIDQDRDGAITEEEMAAAPRRLANRDLDDDEIVVLAELKDTPVEMMVAQPAMMSSRRRVTEPDTAIWLSDRSFDLNRRWGMVQFQLQELYSYGDPVGPSDWPMTPELFRLVDTDGDEELSRAELPALEKVPAHLVLDVLFDGQNADDRRPRIQLREISSEIAALKPHVIELPTRVSLTLPSMEVEFYVNEDPALTNLADAVHNQFLALDRDKNNYLEAGEFPEMLPGLDASFAALDSDSDGKVYESDLLAYAEQRSLVARAQVRSRAADQEDALFTALDSDGDGRLNGREMRQATERLRSFDRNGDQRVQSDEIPGSMIVAFVRGNVQQDDQLFAAPTTAYRGQKSDAPRWFLGMDGNVDGEVSPREFFGPAELFRQIDVNQDGYLSPAEAQAVK